MASELDDLVAFLLDAKPEVRRQAAEIVLGLTAAPDGIIGLKPAAAKLCNSLFRLIGDADGLTSRRALTALVNLSHDPGFTTQLLSMNVVGRVMEYLRDKTCSHVDLLMMLLSNISRDEAGSAALLQLEAPGLEGLHMALLLKLFMTSGVTLAPGDADPYQHIANMITNTTRLQQGRQLLLEPGRGLLQALAAQLASPTLLRRRGAAGALRNCYLSGQEDGTLEQLVADTAVLSRLLAPLSGQPSQREADTAVRLALAEAVQVLASSATGRAALYDLDAPALLKKGYEEEQHPGVCAAMEQAARHLLFDSDTVEVEGRE